MSIFNHFQHIDLTNDQRNALKKLNGFLESKEKVFILKGYAGTGKTTLLKGIIEYIRSSHKKYGIMAPTGRAAKIIRQKTKVEATTIHKGIYSYVDIEETDNSEMYDKDDIYITFSFGIRDNADINNTIFIIDESSMVSDVENDNDYFRFGSGRVLHDLIEYSKIQESKATNKIIFIGDPAQLSPIAKNVSPALDPAYLKKEYNLDVSTAEMKEVKRQDVDNGILQAAIKMRQCLTSGYLNSFNLRENKRDIFNPSYQEYLTTYKAQQDPKIIICYKNKTAADLNKQIRKDKYGKDLPIQPSDTVIIGANNYLYHVMNGEFAIVNEVDPSVEKRTIPFKIKSGDTTTITLTWRKVKLILIDNEHIPVSGYFLENYLYGDADLTKEKRIRRARYIDFKNRHPDLKPETPEFKEAIIKDIYYNCILLKYGYAITCHKAQGGEWKNVFVFWDKGILKNFDFYESKHNSSGKTNPDFYRWAYTATTRASQKLFCINPPYFSPFSKMVYAGEEVEKTLRKLTGQKAPPIDINIKDVQKELEKFGLQDKPSTLQNHFIHCWYHLKQHHIDIIDWEKVNYEIRYVFKKENQTTGFKYWVNKKNQFTKFQYLPTDTETSSKQLFEYINKILNDSADINVNRNDGNNASKHIKFDISKEEEKPFLKMLYDHIKKNLKDDEIISEIKHLEYRERYTIRKNNYTYVIDFQYDGKGSFSRVNLQTNECNNPEMLNNIKTMVDNLRSI